MPNTIDLRPDVCLTLDQMLEQLLFVETDYETLIEYGEVLMDVHAARPFFGFKDGRAADMETEFASTDFEKWLRHPKRKNQYRENPWRKEPPPNASGGQDKPLRLSRD